MPIGVITTFIGASTLIVLIRRRPYLYGATQASRSLAGDWTDVEARSRPSSHDSNDSADPEARWGHCNVNLKIQKGEMVFGYYWPRQSWS